MVVSVLNHFNDRADEIAIIHHFGSFAPDVFKTYHSILAHLLEAVIVFRKLKRFTSVYNAYTDLARIFKKASVV